MITPAGKLPSVGRIFRALPDPADHSTFLIRNADEHE
jgi:hypothetical protein